MSILCPFYHWGSGRQSSVRLWGGFGKVLFFKPNLIIKDSNLTMLFYYSKYAFHGRMKVKFIHLFNLD